MIYKLLLSNSKNTISLSEEELEKFKQNISANFIEFSEGIVNPSFVVSITCDYDATRAARLAERKQNALPAPEEYKEQGTTQMKDALAKYRSEIFPELPAKK